MVKNIVLCSDGTGNKGGYGDDSNVYKLYRYVDIHNKNHPQISYYDNGVGTNVDGESVKQNKFWRAISGAFGFGFENNVRDLYEYLAINYEAGDQIYVFGFSRGASTVRAFTGLIQDCGLLNKYDQHGKRKNQEEFKKQIRQAIQVYRKRPAEKLDKSYDEYKSEKAYQAYKLLADDFKQNYAIKSDDYAPNGNLKIHFLGVWDTVSALGFPKDWSLLFDWFFSLMDKLSESKWPHNYYNFHLNEDIDYACQALAIDDKRKTFFPKVWKESEGNKDSVEQVWFAGVHSNVGGGYPRNGLSNVALTWMMTQAKKRKLVFITDTLKDTNDFANVQGKMYNSRDGFAVYYRYQPRDIQDICKNRLTGKVKIHNTVMDRMKMGTADYTPTFLPAEFEVVDTTGKTRNIKNDPAQWEPCKEEAQDLVKKQQNLYRIFVESTVVLLAIVLCFWANPPTSVQSYLNSGTTDNVFFLFAWIHTVLTYILPVIFENFLTYILCVHWWIFVVMVVILYGMFKRRDFLATKLKKVLSATRAIVLSHLKDS